MVYSSELIKGTLKTIVLKLLADNKKMYGYEITQRVREVSGDRIQITEGALYPTLHALEADKLVTTQVEYIGKRMRKYYSLSPAGKATARERVKELSAFMQTMALLLDIQPKTA
ncbi:MAG TPA: PadR family transcriptional regulator [Puia sp.]|nr:PadR family transcriptional regulator [Puia sp.]